MYLLLIKYVETLFRSDDLNIFKLTGSEVIGLKFSGKLRSPFLWVKMVAGLVGCTVKVLLLSTSVQISNMNDLKYGHRFNQIIEIWSNGHHEPENFRRLIIRVIFWQDSGEKLKEIFDSFNLGIQEGIVNTFMRFTHFNTLVN